MWTVRLRFCLLSRLQILCERVHEQRDQLTHVLRHLLIDGNVRGERRALVADGDMTEIVEYVVLGVGREAVHDGMVAIQDVLADSRVAGGQAYVDVVGQLR